MSPVPYSQVRPIFVAAPALRASLPERVQSKVWTELFPAHRAKLCVVMYSCLQGQAPGTSQTSAYQCPTTQHGSIFNPLLGFFGGYSMPAQHTRSTGFLCDQPVAFELSTRQLEIRILAGTTSDVCWGRIYLHCTEAFSILEMFQDDTLYKLTYLLTYLLKFYCVCHHVETWKLATHISWTYDIFKFPHFISALLMPRIPTTWRCGYNIFY